MHLVLKSDFEDYIAPSMFMIEKWFNLKTATHNLTSNAKVFNGCYSCQLRYCCAQASRW
jgi:hypothetical protein